MAEKKIDLFEEEEEFTLDEQKKTVDLTPENARFFRSEGGLISLELTDEGETKVYERVMLLRAFPITNPDEFISVREPTKRKTSRAKEVGMIRRASDFDEATNVLFHEELDKRYFTPQIHKIHSIKEKFSFYYWDVDTSAGHIVFLMNNPFNNIRILEDGRLLISDIDGSVFVIPDPKKLDAASYRRIEAYL
ncbi:MAG: DUF1854 domain-containing protein [Ruminococcaceae bacterium]|nr:DUF1854 domain-containing protein [Oscillospiraceae bacterium]